MLWTGDAIRKIYTFLDFINLGVGMPLAYPNTSKKYLSIFVNSWTLQQLQIILMKI